MVWSMSLPMVISVMLVMGVLGSAPVTVVLSRRLPPPSWEGYVTVGGKNYPVSKHNSRTFCTHHFYPATILFSLKLSK